MPPLGVVPDGVASPHSDPVRNGTILLELLTQFSLDTKSLEGRLLKDEKII